MVANVVVIPMWVFVAGGLAVVAVVVLAVYLFGRRGDE
jgi:hypothetical protein